jgi:hypothetical protein
MTNIMHQYDCGCGNGTPECFISVNKNRIKQKNGIVYLKNGTEFEIEFYNLSADIQKAVITINGKKQSDALVLKPGEHFYLDRFMDDKKRLKFDTYEVDDVAAVRKAIENNGEVKVEFFREQKPVQSWTTTTISYPTWTDNNYFKTHSAVYLGTPISRTRGASTGAKGITPQAFYNSNASSNTVNCSAGLNNMSFQTMDFASAEPAKMETGRVEQGGQSNQDFKPVYYSFEYLANTTYTFKLLPISRKGEEVVTTDKVRSYCPQCGRRIKSGWNNCPGCGFYIRSI